MNATRKFLGSTHLQVAVMLGVFSAWAACDMGSSRRSADQARVASNEAVQQGSETYRHLLRANWDREVRNEKWECTSFLAANWVPVYGQGWHLNVGPEGIALTQGAKLIRHGDPLGNTQCVEVTTNDGQKVWREVRFVGGTLKDGSRQNVQAHINARLGEWESLNNETIDKQSAQFEFVCAYSTQGNAQHPENDASCPAVEYPAQPDHLAEAQAPAEEPTEVPTNTTVPTGTPTATSTPTPTDTREPTVTSAVPTDTPTVTPSPTVTRAPLEQDLAAATPTSPVVSTVEPTSTKEPTSTALPTETPTPANTPTPWQLLWPTNAPGGAHSCCDLAIKAMNWARDHGRYQNEDIIRFTGNRAPPMYHKGTFCFIRDYTGLSGSGVPDSCRRDAGPHQNFNSPRAAPEDAQFGQEGDAVGCASREHWDNSFVKFKNLCVPDAYRERAAGQTYWE